MILIVQNDPEVPPGEYGREIAAAGIRSKLVAPYAGDRLPDAAECCAVIILGGEMGVHEKERYPFLREVGRLAIRCFAERIPLLGICLGGQLLADALGGVVTPSSVHGEKGMSTVRLTAEGAEDPIFAGLSGEFLTFQWHNDSFVPPPGAVHLAGSERCPFQAFRCGSCYGIQFHPEVDKEIVSRWGRSVSEDEAARIASSFASSAPAYRSASRQLLKNFFHICGCLRSSKLARIRRHSIGCLPGHCRARNDW